MYSGLTTLHSDRQRIVFGAAAILAVLAGGFLGALDSEGISDILSLVVALGAIGLQMVSLPLGMVILVVAGRTTAGSFVNGPFDLAFWCLLGIILAGAATKQRGKVVARLRHPIAIFLLLFVGLVVAHFAITHEYAYAQEKTLRVLVYGIAFLLLPVWLLDDVSQLRRFFVGFALVADAFGLVALAWTLSTVSFSGLLRISLPGSGPITLARVLALGTIACVALAFADDRRRRLYLANSACLALLTFLTGSRAPALFLFITLLIVPWLALSNRSLRRFSPRLFLFVIILAAALIPVWRLLREANLPVVQRFELLFQEDKGASIDERAYYYKLALHLSRENSWHGYGTGSWALVMGDGNTIAYPHNVLLETLFEQGIVGLIALVLFVAAVLLSGIGQLLSRRSSPWKDSIALGAYCSFLFAFMAAQTSGDIYDNRMIWFYGGLVLTTRSFTSEKIPT